MFRKLTTPLVATSATATTTTTTTTMKSRSTPAVASSRGALPSAAAAVGGGLSSSSLSTSSSSSSSSPLLLASSQLLVAPRRFQSSTGEGGGEKANKETEGGETPQQQQKEGGEKPGATQVDEGHHHKLKTELQDANTKIGELKQDYLYAMAEADNARRIARDDVDKARNYGITSFGKEMLEVVDTLDKAVEAFDKASTSIGDDKALNSIRTGVKLSLSVLLKNLSKVGIEKMETKRGDVFNPNHHDALFKAEVSQDVPSDHISMVVKTGYMIKDRVLRPAQVGVAEQS